jgi:hypothetical protein
MTIIKNHFEVFLVTSKKHGNGIIYSIAVITFYLPRPLKLTNQNQSQIQSVQLFITFAT